MSNANKKILITDTSVLINFLNIDRIDLLDSYPGLFFITEHVADEITEDFPHQQARLNQAIEAKSLTVVSVSGIEELKIFGDLIKDHRLGLGECSAIACAINRKYILAIDDVRARKQAAQKDQQLELITTQDIVVTLIQHNQLDITEADLIKNLWEAEFRFSLKLKSFSEVLS